MSYNQSHSPWEERSLNIPGRSSQSSSKHGLISPSRPAYSGNGHRNEYAEKMANLDEAQFNELKQDVYDEEMRRKNGEKNPLPRRDKYSDTRNQAREKLATFQSSKFNKLCSDFNEAIIIRRNREGSAVNSSTSRTSDNRAERTKGEGYGDSMPQSPSISEYMITPTNSEYMMGPSSSMQSLVSDHGSRQASDYTMSNSDATGKMDRLIKDNKAIQEHCRVLQIELKAKEEDLREFNELKTKYDILREKHAKLQNQVDPKVHKEMKAKYEKLQGEHHNLQSVVEDVKVEINEMRSELAKMEDLRVENKDLKARVSVYSPMAKLDPVKTSRDGVINAAHIKTYNSAMDVVLNNAKNISDRLVALKTVVEACNGIKKDTEGRRSRHEGPLSVDDLNRQLSQLMSALSSTVYLYEDDTPVVPQMLLPVTAAQLTVTVAEITKGFGLYDEQERLMSPSSRRNVH